MEDFSSDWIKTVMGLAGMELTNVFSQRSVWINGMLYIAISVKRGCLDVAVVLRFSGVENLKEAFIITFFPKLLCSW